MLAPMNFEGPLMKRVKKPSDMPDRAFVIQFHGTQTVHHEGDERSRTNPGHGYPAYNEEFLLTEQYVTLDEAHWKESIWALAVVNKERKDFVAFEYHRPVIETTVTVKVNGK